MLSTDLILSTLCRSLQINEILRFVHEGQGKEVRLDQLFGLICILFKLQAVVLTDQYSANRVK